MVEMGQGIRYSPPIGNNAPPNQTRRPPSIETYGRRSISAEDEAFFLCPNCDTYQPIESIAEHTAKCNTQDPRTSGGSILRRRPLIGTASVIPAGPPRYGGGSSTAGPGPTTMRNRQLLSTGGALPAAGPGPATTLNMRRPSPSGQPPAKRRRVQPPAISSPAVPPTASIDVIELSSDDEPPPRPRSPPVRFFDERRHSSTRPFPQTGRLTPPPPYSA